mgnify:FL=1
MKEAEGNVAYIEGSMQIYQRFINARIFLIFIYFLLDILALKGAKTSRHVDKDY